VALFVSATPVKTASRWCGSSMIGCASSSRSWTRQINRARTAALSSHPRLCV